MLHLQAGRFFELPDPGGAGTQPAPGAPPAAPVAPPAGDEPAAPSHKDWNAMAASVRTAAEAAKAIPALQAQMAAIAQSLAGLKPAEPPKPSKDPATPVDPNEARIAVLEAQIKEGALESAFREAIADAGIAGDRRAAFRSMWIGEQRPTQDLAAWVKAKVTLLGDGKAAAAPPPALLPPQAAPVPDPGAPLPQGAQPGQPDGHPLTWKPEVVSKMTPVEFRTAISDYEAKSGLGRATNTLRSLRARSDALNK